MAEADPASVPNSALDLSKLPTVELDQPHLAARRIVGLNSGDSRSRAFNLLRTSLMNLVGEATAPRLIGVTSATPAAGKSFLSANMALSLAKVAKGDVMLVDLDLHRGSIASELGLRHTPGVRDFLAGDIDLRQMGVRIADMPLAIFPTSMAGADSAELLAGERFDQLLAACRSGPANSVVLFDLPPVFANDDAMLTIKHLDGYLLVVDSSETSKAHVEDAMAMLAPSPCIGAILNRYTGRIFDKYGYGYGARGYGKYYDS